MSIIYNLIVQFAAAILNILAFFNSKLSLFVKGRKQTIAILKKTIKQTDSTIWIHAASLGEYEQGLPIMERLKDDYPQHKLILTFFSPSGYEVKKNCTIADVVTYLPLDTKAKVSSFLDYAHPELVIFIKYEIWPNYLNELKRRAIPVLLISALFKENQIYFRHYGIFMRKALNNFSFIFVQNKKSNELLETINIYDVTVAGDTRFDRVAKILELDNSLDFMADFKQDKFCFVAGSTWPEDEIILANFINTSKDSIKHVIAPHNIKDNHIAQLKNNINREVILYSEIKKKNLKDYQVLIIDTIGLLTKIYSYADIAYVGGGFATGLHNTLEPAVFGIPVIIGPKYEGFNEAENLVVLGGISSIQNSKEFETQFYKLFENVFDRKKIGKINDDFIKNSKGASSKIMLKIHKLLKTS